MRANLAMAAELLPSLNAKTRATKIGWRGHPTDKGERVRFRISDVFLPSPEDLPSPPSAEVETEGAIVDFSDSGTRQRAFAVVELDDGQTMVVPVEKIRSLGQKHC